MVKRWTSMAEEHLKVLSRRSKEVIVLLKRRDKMGQYNLTEQKRIMAKIRKAKKLIAEAGFI